MTNSTSITSTSKNKVKACDSVTTVNHYTKGTKHFIETYPMIAQSDMTLQNSECRKDLGTKGSLRH